MKVDPKLYLPRTARSPLDRDSTTTNWGAQTDFCQGTKVLGALHRFSLLHEEQPSPIIWRETLDILWR